MSLLSTVVTLLATPIINRFRGGGFGGELFDEETGKLPGRPLYPASVAIGLLAFWQINWVAGIIFGVGYLLWGTPAWGYLITLGYKNLNRTLEGVEKWLVGISQDKYKLALMLRHLLFVAPTVVALGFFVTGWEVLFFALPFSILATAGYITGWENSFFAKYNPVMLGELVTGLAWGLLIIVTGLLV